MVIWNRLSSLSIYPKLVFTFLIALTPMSVISWQMNEAGSANVQKEISESLASRSTLYMNMLEFDLDRVIDLLQEYVNDDDLLNLSLTSEGMTEIDKMQAQLRLKRRLDLLKHSSKFILNASAFIPSMNRVISAKDNVISDFNESQFRALTQTTNRFESPFLTWNDRLFISLPYPDPAVSGDRQPTFLLTVEVAKQELADVLRDFTNEGGTAVLAGNKMPWTINGAGGEPDRATLERIVAAAAKPTTAPDAIRSVTMKGESFRVVAKSSPRLDMTLVMYVPSRNVTASLDAYRFWLYALTAASILVVLSFSYSIYLMIHQPLKKLVRSFRKLEQGNFTLELSYRLRDEFGYLYGQFNGMVKRLNVLVHEVYEQRYRARLAELRHLQSQINPHFLYNSYFILYRMAMLKDHDNVIYFTKHLGEYFQYITRDGAEEVRLESEIRHARTYTDIQSVRFGGRIRVDFGELPNEAAAVAVPRLILQPLIENAYNHGLEHKRRDGRIKIAIACAADRIVIAIEDNGETMSAEKLAELQAMLQRPDEAAESTGLLNVHRRIRIRYGDSGGLALSLGDEGGLRVTMTIPREAEVGHDSTVDRG